MGVLKIAARAVALLLALVAMTIAVGSTPRTRPVRLMPLGDSHTAAPAEKSYRAALWRALRASGHDVDFVGSVRDRPRDYDRDHEGHGGWTAREILDGRPGHFEEGSVRDWARAFRPDVVVLLAGTNDLARRRCELQGVCCDDATQLASYAEARKEAIDSIAAIIDILRWHRPDVHVAVGRIPPNVFVHPGEIARFNEDLLAELSLTRESALSPLQFVDLYDGMNWDLDSPDRDTNDGIHWNPKGTERVAERIERALVDADFLRVR